MTKRSVALTYAKVAGYHNDTKSFTRLIIESRVNRQAMNTAWDLGQQAKANGARCDCFFCQRERETQLCETIQQT
jgi:hypothetical protein